MISNSFLQTHQIASDLVKQISDEIGNKAIIFALSGPLGAGKTELTKGLAAALGVSANIISPTYVLETEYPIPNSKIYFAHLDTYRLETEQELAHLGLERRIANKDIIVVEWANRFSDYLHQLAKDAHLIQVYLDILPEENQRSVKIGA